MRRAGLVVAIVGAFAGCGLWPAAHVPLPKPVYYTDLGPASIDVSSYDPAQRENYAVFSRACSACHTLARAVNSPVQSRAYWRYHLARMSLHSRVRRDGPIPRDELKAALDFLEYDARIRKIENKAKFELLDEELKRRYDPILERYLWDLYREGAPAAEPSRPER